MPDPSDSAMFAGDKVGGVNVDSCGVDELPYFGYVLYVIGFHC